MRQLGKLAARVKQLEARLAAANATDPTHQGTPMSEFATLIDLRAILKLLPHRYPFCWWTASLNWKSASASSSRKRHHQRAVFVGHFDGYR